MTPRPRKTEDADQRWIYRSGNDFKLVLQPKRRVSRRDRASGELYTVIQPGIYVRFVAGRFELNEFVAKQMGHDLKFLVELMNTNNANGKEYRLVHAPDHRPTTEDLAYEQRSQDVADGKEIAITQGARTAGIRAK